MLKYPIPILLFSGYHCNRGFTIKQNIHGLRYQRIFFCTAYNLENTLLNESRANLKKLGKYCSGLSCRWAFFTAWAFGFKPHLIFHRVELKTPFLYSIWRIFMVAQSTKRHQTVLGDKNLWYKIIYLPTQSANSNVFGTVADSMMIFTCSGRRIRTSSHTTPRSGSLI